MTGAVVADVVAIAVGRAAEIHPGGTLRRVPEIRQSGPDVSALYSFAVDSFRKP
jgi:hypothetical protein